MNEIYVFGHKNPDTDSVTAAISLAHLKKQLGMNAVPKILGNINNETEYVLNYFKVNKPDYLNNVKLQINDLNFDNKLHVKNTNSIYYAYNYMAENNVNNLPIITKENKIMGLIAMKNITKYMISGDSKKINTNINNILETIEGTNILNFDETIKGTIIVAAFKSETFINNVQVNNNSIIIVGDREKITKHCIQNKVKLIVVTGNNEISKENLELAQKNKVNIIKTSLHTFDTSKLITLSNNVTDLAQTTNIVSIKEDELVSEFINIANKTKYSYYPVINKNDEFIGNVKLTDTTKQNKKQVILVDHNEYDQSVDGLTEAEILEIVDHHNIGTVGTKSPINFRNMPVGSDNTVIYQLYKENNIKIPKEIAGLMLSGIVSDTLLFVSPTTTELDKVVAKNLANIAEVNLEEYGLNMLKAGTSLKGKTEEDILFGDFKVYEVNNKKIGVTQVSTFDINDFNESIETYKELLNKNAENNNYDVFTFLITDILKNGSYIYYNENAKDIVSNAFDIENIEQGTYLDGCVSRKKQVIPKIMKALE